MVIIIQGLLLVKAQRGLGIIEFRDILSLLLQGTVQGR
jgi:hypothetical protein